MTEKRYYELRKGMKKDTVCHYSKGEFCISYVNNGKCVCLDSTRFKDNKCPFFRDKRTMSEMEIDDYFMLVYGERKRKK